MARSKSSGRWLAEHHSDPYVQQARSAGYRSRAAFKLLQMQKRDRLLTPGMLVVDLGAAPGGWSQVAREAVGDKGRIVALDILPMEPIAGVEFIHGDFREAGPLEELGRVLGDVQPALVLSDMAPNMSGVRAADQAGSMYLAELAHDFAVQYLEHGGSLLVKVFRGAGFDDYLRSLRTNFSAVRLRKPEASRGRSAELYVQATGLRRC